MFEIHTLPDGTFSDIRFKRSSALDSVLSEVERGHGGIISIWGANRYDEIAALSREMPRGFDLVMVGAHSGMDDSGILQLHQPSELTQSIGGPQRRLPGSLFRLTETLREAHRPIDLARFDHALYLSEFRNVIGGSKDTARLVPLFDDYVRQLDATLIRSIFIFSVNLYVDIDNIIPLAVWLSRPRQLPMIMLTQNKPNIPTRWAVTTVESQTVLVVDIISEIEKRFKLSPDDINTAYRVWSLSRPSRRDVRSSGSGSKATITMPSARDLCSVVSETYKEKIRSAAKPSQVSAPVKFEFVEDGITVLGGHSSRDDEVVVRAAAASLLQRCGMMRATGALANQLPTFPSTLDRMEAILSQIAHDKYDDGHVVALGMEFNAVQWEINAIHTQLMTATLAEATALFANAHLFLDRFNSWKSFTGRCSLEREDSAFASFAVSKGLLVSAISENNLMEHSAASRVETILQRASGSTLAPVVAEGVVSTGENLSSTIIGGLSDLIKHEGKEIGSEVLSETRKEAAKAAVSFSLRHGPDMVKLMASSDHKWASWLDELIKNGQGLVDWLFEHH